MRDEVPWVLKDDDKFSRKGGDWGLAAEAEQRAHTKARNWKRAPWPWGEQKAGGRLVRSRAVEGGEGEGQAQEGSLMMHTAGRGATGGAMRRGVEGGPAAVGRRRAPGTQEPATALTSGRVEPACRQRVERGGPGAARGSRHWATPDPSPPSICSFSMVGLRSWQDMGLDPDCANHSLGHESLFNLRFLSAEWENTAARHQTVLGSDDPCHCLGTVLGTQWGPVTAASFTHFRSRQSTREQSVFTASHFGPQQFL